MPTTSSRGSRAAANWNEFHGPDHRTHACYSYYQILTFKRDNDYRLINYLYDPNAQPVELEQMVQTIQPN